MPSCSAPRPNNNHPCDRSDGRRSPGSSKIGSAHSLADKPRVVIADDDGTVRMVACLAMERAGFEVIEAADGVAALEAIERVAPDLVLLDVTMPGMDGFTACALLRQMPHSERIPVIIITGLDDTDSIEQAYQAGATDFVIKPINWVVLRHRVRYIMRASKALNEAWENQERLSNAQRVAELGDWEWDLKRDRFRASTQVYRMLGKSDEYLLGSPTALLEHAHRDDVDRVRDALDGVADRAEPFTFDHRIVSADGKVRFVHHQVEAARTDDQGRATRIIGTIQDITKRKQSEERIRQLAYFDALTGLPNRLLFNEQVRNALSHAARSASKLAVMFVDLDGFKRVNDTLGHDAGDELLKTVAARVASSVRATDTVSRTDLEQANNSVARLGGDEFVVLLGELAQPEDAAVIARRILQVLTEPVRVAGQEIVVSCSIGIAVYPDDSETAESLLMNADVAMYRAKARGRNTFQFYDRSMNAMARERLALETTLRHALEREELELRFQPCVDFHSNAIIGVQTHLCWHHPERGLMPAEEFIDVARQAQLLFPIELWMLQTSCRVAKAWRVATGRGFVIGNKLSGTFLRRSEAVPAIERLLAESQLDPRLLEIQVAAHDFVGEIDALERAIGRLRELGVRFAVTEFGAESTSLAQLKRLKIERLRIAPSLVRNVVSDADSAAICGSIVALSRALGLSTLAEGIESAVQYEVLRQLGCSAYQGPHFRTALNAQEIRALLAEMGESAAAMSERVSA